MLRAIPIIALFAILGCGASHPTSVQEARIGLERPIRLSLVDDHLPIIEVTMNGIPGLRFLLDCGAGISTIDREQAESLGIEFLPYSDASSVTGAGGGTVQYDSYVVADLSLDEGFSLDNIRLTAIESKALRMTGVLGIIGQDLLARLVLIVDMSGQTVHMLPPGTEFKGIESYLGEAEIGLGEWGVMPLELRPCPFIELRLKGVEGEAPTLEIDTGAKFSSFPGVAIDALKLEPTGTVKAYGVDGAYETPTYLLKNFKLLKFKINCEIKRSRLECGLLGMDILSEFIFVLDGPGSSLWLFHRDG